MTVFLSSSSNVQGESYGYGEEQEPFEHKMTDVYSVSVNMFMSLDFIHV